jgi:hypothetical protein
MGTVKSNSRRSQPPIDNLTFYYLPRSQGGLGGQPASRLDPADASVFFRPGTTTANPLITNSWGNGNLLLVYDRSAQPVYITETLVNSAGGYRIQASPLAALVNVPDATGAVNNSIGTNNNPAGGTIQPVQFNGMAGFATLMNYDYANRYGDAILTNTNVYDFYNNLIDGDSKRETRDFKRGRVDVTQTFLNNRLSYNLTYNREFVEFDRYAALGTNTTIEVDAAKELPDGSPNPYAGRAFIKESPFTGSRYQTFDTEAWRAVGLYRFDFRKDTGFNLAKWLGSHDFTGILSGNDRITKRYDYLSNGVGFDWINNRMVTNNPQLRNQFNGPARTINVFYISDSISGKSLNQDLGLMNIGPGTPPETGTYTYRYFDASVAGFNRNVSPTDADPVFGRAAQNPANYRGWTNGPITLYGAPTDKASRDFLTRQRDYFKENTKSKALSWQGRVLNGGVVGTYGWREDDYRTWIYTWNYTTAAFDPQQADFRFAPREQKGNATNWTVALHAHRFIPKLPVEVTFYANRGENTNPDPVRIGVLREPILSAAGKTEDYSMEVRSRNNKWSARLTRYETSVSNASSQGTLQSQKFLLEQAFFQGFNGTYRILSGQEQWGAVSQNLLTAEANGTLTAAQRTQLEAQRRNIPVNIANANEWLEFEKRFAAQFPDAVAAWLPAGGVFPGSTAVPGMRWTYPENAVLTEDNVSKGWELELVANPTPNWRVLVNGSKADAIRDNLPGARFKEIMDFLVRELDGPAGAIPGGFVNADGSPGVGQTPRDLFFNLRDSYLVQLQNNGQRVTELSRWRGNFVTNYSFRRGFLRNFEVGGYYRYESPKTIGYGYKTVTTSRGPTIETDLTKVYKSPAFDTVGLTLRHRYKLLDRYNWTIQLNIDNLLQAKDEITATATQPDGSMRRGMIREGRSWVLTNSIDF